MKTVLLFLLFLITKTCCYSQDKFTLNSIVGLQTIQINGREYLIDSIEMKIKTNYPKFDTIVFTSYNDVPIICNFKPDTVYSITGACCAELDIIPESKLKNDSAFTWDEDDLDKIHNQFLDKPFISIRTKKNPKDSIYAWHADAACETEHRLINSSLWRLGVPPKCFYWSNITTIQFFKTDNKMPNHEKSDLEEFLGINNIIELTSISFRLFDNERFIIIYDKKKSIAKIIYE
ncbi:MAG: hypothetical protein FWH36_06330 [Lentimicrobiaceae bacterium]|nr:hypothetical protein [Lentimicrobiaceae bacterium]